MRGRYGSADAVEAAKNHVPLILCKPNRPMDRGRNGARYFRNPPQPHMCIQDFIEDSNDPCFINVLSWQKISTPRKPEDPIPLYGGMRVPHNSSAAMTLSSHFGTKVQPVIFAVMANPEILRLSGKTAPDPSDRDALVELMIDFVEAMNPDVRFKREFTVLRDRDLAGELKDIWLAVQAKRERERGENGRREVEKYRDNRDEQWREEVRQRELQNIDHETEQNILPLSVIGQDEDQIKMVQANIGQEDNGSYQVEELDVVGIERQSEKAGEVPSVFLPTSSTTTTTTTTTTTSTTITTTDVSTTPSTESLNRSTQYTGAINYTEESVYSLIRSHYEQEFNRTESDTMNTSLRSDQTEQRFPTMYSSTCFSSTCKHTTDNVIFPVFSECDGKESSSASIAEAVDEMNATRITVQQDKNFFAAYKHHEVKSNKKMPPTEDEHLSSHKSPSSPVRHITHDTKYHQQDGGSTSNQGKPYQNPGSITSEHHSVEDDHMFSAYSGEMFLNNKAQVPNMAGRNHEDLLPALGDSTGVKFPIGSGHSTVAIP